jgi:signal transduction histidine kinase
MPLKFIKKKSLFKNSLPTVYYKFLTSYFKQKETKLTSKVKVWILTLRRVMNKVKKNKEVKKEIRKCKKDFENEYLLYNI